eukprot:TRINITY_DN95300_c0_g1_i1.p1 TRINITY_DN95300_c0_g1~~TRINITY_DN95300_c0_g1_i1.p1  ORF type:complete len:434 (-),score=39.97 TRINITY_DN95300_c0_g1_i1:176-1477(-)
MIPAFPATTPRLEQLEVGADKVSATVAVHVARTLALVEVMSGFATAEGWRLLLQRLAACEASFLEPQHSFLSLFSCFPPCGEGTPDGEASRNSMQSMVRTPFIQEWPESRSNECQQVKMLQFLCELLRKRRDSLAKERGPTVSRHLEEIDKDIACAEREIARRTQVARSSRLDAHNASGKLQVGVTCADVDIVARPVAMKSPQMLLEKSNRSGGQATACTYQALSGMAGDGCGDATSSPRPSSPSTMGSPPKAPLDSPMPTDSNPWVGRWVWSRSQSTSASSGCSQHGAHESRTRHVALHSRSSTPRRDSMCSQNANSANDSYLRGHEPCSQPVMHPPLSQSSWASSRPPLLPAQELSRRQPPSYHSSYSPSRQSPQPPLRQSSRSPTRPSHSCCCPSRRPPLGPSLVSSRASSRQKPQPSRSTSQPPRAPWV